MSVSPVPGLFLRHGNSSERKHMRLSHTQWNSIPREACFVNHRQRTAKKVLVCSREEQNVTTRRRESVKVLPSRVQECETLL